LLGNFELGGTYVDGRAIGAVGVGGPGDVGSAEAAAIFSVSTTFPWGSE
jgi:hypothetical protein